MQKTLSADIHIQGIGLHSGCRSDLYVKPAPADTGIVFVRTDLSAQPKIKALYSNIVDTQNCSCLGNGEGVRVSTVEHLMGALYMAGIDNALIEVNNQEIPIMDGSAKEFYDILSKAELVGQKSPRRYLKILKNVSFADAKGNTVTLSPNHQGLRIRFEIEFPSKIVGRQTFDSEITCDIFGAEIACSRTFCEKQAVDYLQSLGLIKGGSLDNAVVLDGDSLLNPEGFRVEQECVKHKVLDAVGDLYLSGYRVIGELTAVKTGHYHTNELLKNLFADPENYQFI